MIRSLVLCLSFLLSLPAWSASVTAVKGTKALVDLEGADVHEGDEFFLISNNKKVAILKIKQVKEGRAVGEVLKGKAQAGYSLRAKGNSTGGTSASVARETESKATEKNEEYAPTRDMSYSRTLRPSYGVLGEYLMDNMTVVVKDALTTEKPALKGTGFGVGGFYEYIMNRDMSLRILGALEQFNVSGTTVQATGCNKSRNCDAKITYLSAYGLAKYYLTQNKYRAWGGIGGGFLIAVAKSSTALSASDISTNQVLTVAMGLDWQLSRKNYVPVSIEYNYFPPSDTVTANSIAIKVGYAWQ
ncbi:MAG: outer membrane beta-barrel protein [Bdellovibrio sp.]|nr:outer membrane beta-barrel protein [Bdellovibrio sp.]